MTTNQAEILSRYPEADSALHSLGELYTDDEGHAVWRIRDLDGRIVEESLASDRDAVWHANHIVGGCDFADFHEHRS